MRRLKIGHLEIRSLYVILLIIGIAIISGGLLVFSIFTNSYEYLYTFDIKDLEQINIGTKQAKGEIFDGKVVVNSGTAILIIEENTQMHLINRVVDSGIIEAESSYVFSIKTKYSYTIYSGKLIIDGTAQFYSNIDTDITGYKKQTLTEIINDEPRIIYHFEPFKLK